MAEVRALPPLIRVASAVSEIPIVQARSMLIQQTAGLLRLGGLARLGVSCHLATVT